MLNLREFYSTITKPADTSRGVVILFPDKTVVFNEFKNIMYEINKVYYEEEFGITSYYIEELKGLITAVDSELLNGESKPDIIISLDKLKEFNIKGIYPLIEKRDMYTIFDKNVHNEPFNADIRERILASKANGGRYNYFVNATDKEYLMMIYKGLVPMTKNDIISVSIYRSSIVNEFTKSTFLAKFEIERKKDKLHFTEYILFRDL